MTTPSTFSSKPRTVLANRVRWLFDTACLTVICSIITAANVSAQETSAQETSAEESLTFFATSDSHYEAVMRVERNDRNRVTIERMNGLPGQPWPEQRRTVRQTAGRAGARRFD